MDRTGLDIVEEVETDVGKFLIDPTLANLEKLGSNAADVIDVHLQSIRDPESLTVSYVEALCCVCALSADSARAARAGASLFRSLVARARFQWPLANALLRALRLIKVSVGALYVMFRSLVARARFQWPLANALLRALRLIKWPLANALLRALRLIKSENKDYKIRWRVSPCYMALAKEIDEPYFPTALRDTLKFFISSKKESLPAEIRDVIEKHPNLYT
ncbi:unnamed protein product [Euphydryas editha]|uniref:Symplekin C-terminal domain-containing protein n=1 Tax=Euphydryas editha TaxID=104508 RepID=A0AAU9T9B9_EUPED|nr:unnamed protein product [Euphydryas editha]